MKLRHLVMTALVLLPGLAHAQSAIPQAAPSPWSLHDALGAPADVTLKGSIRGRLESIDGQARPGLNASDTLFDLRTTLFAEYRTGPWRFGAEIYDSRAYGGDLKTPLGTNDVNVAELVQAYGALDLTEPFGPGTRARVEVGRMALNLGTRRLLSSEDWRNTTNAYAGVRTDLTLAQGASATLFYLRPTVRTPDDRQSLLDNVYRADRDSSDTVIWGGLASKARVLGPATAELSFYHLDEQDSPGHPTRDRQLDTFGGRLYREAAPGKTDFEIEAFQQTGEIRTSLAANAPTQSVSAQFLHADLGHSFTGPWKPRLSLRFDLVTGDRGGSRYGRFDTLYGMRGAELAPSGLYNSVGRANLVSPGVQVELAPDPGSDLLLRYRPLWLASKTDSFSTTNVRDPTGQSGRFAGHQVEVRWRHWLVVNALRLEANGVYLDKGRFLKEAPNAPGTPDTAFGAVNLTAYF